MMMSRAGTPHKIPLSTRAPLGFFALVIGSAILLAAKPVLANKVESITKLESSAKSTEGTADCNCDGKAQLKPIFPDVDNFKSVLEAQGFKCLPPEDFSKKSKSSKTKGWRCRGLISEYPLPINIFLPEHFTSKPSRLAVHFHGHTNCSSPECHFNTENQDGNYADILNQGKNQTVLVIPESIGKCQTYKDHFSDVSKLQTFIEKISNLTKLEVQNLSFSSHSGGDAIIARIANWGLAPTPANFFEKIDKIGLFDSLYAQRESIATWLNVNLKKPNFHFYGVFVVGPEQSTVNHMKWLENKLPDSKQVHFFPVKTKHMSIMRDGNMADFLD